MDLENAEKKLNQVDSLLTTITRILKKHWLILLLILLGIGIYSIVNTEEEIVEDDNIENVVPLADSTDYQDTTANQDSSILTDAPVVEDSMIENNEETPQ